VDHHLRHGRFRGGSDEEVVDKDQTVSGNLCY
jgi:hypothetical protein